MTLNGKYLTTAEAAKKLGVSDQYLRDLIRGGKCPGEKLGNSWLIPRVWVSENHDRVTQQYENAKSHRPTNFMAYGSLVELVKTMDAKLDALLNALGVTVTNDG